MNIDNIIKKCLDKHIQPNILTEYSADQRLPFDDDYFKNKNYLEQYTDWLEDFGKYGELPPSKLNFWDEIKKAIKYIIDNKLHGRYNLGLDGYNENEIFNKIKNIIGNNLIIIDGDKIYVERQVTIGGTSSSYDSSDRNGKDPKILYNTLVKNYNNNVGGCWSYRKNGAEAYCTENNGDTLTLKGFIRTDDIDFVKTVLLNFHYDNEYEIRVKPNSKVELFEVDFNNRYKIPLKGNLIVNSTYFGNNGKYNGNYATVDDGFGNFELMDRNGKIQNPLEVVKNKITNNVPIDKIFDDIEQINEIFRCGVFFKYKYLIDWNNNVIGNGSIYFDNIKNFIDNYIIVKLNKKYTIINPNGKYIYDGKLWFDYIGNLSEGYSIVILNNKFSFINRRGELIGDGKLWFDHANDFENGFSRVSLNGRNSLLKKDGNLIGNGKLWFDGISFFSEGFAAITYNDKYSFIDINGNLIGNGKLWFDYANYFNDGFAKVEVGDKSTYINANGEYIGNGNLWFDHARNFRNGFAKVELNNNEYYIDTKCNFYDFNTKKPIPSPIENTNENKAYFKNNLRKIISEVLQEYSSDQRLPFDDDKFKNKNYLEQYTDWLEDFGKYGELSSSKLNFWDEIKKAINYIINNNLRNHAGLGLPNNFEMIYNDLRNKIIGNNLVFNEKGNIYVERQVQLNSSATSYDNSDVNGNDPKILYNNLIKNYNNNVGGCWSYKKDGSYSYCSTSNGDNIVMKGYIRTDDIDFVKTVLLNFRYPNEHEIRVKPNSKIEIIETILGCKYKMPLKGSLIVNATYFGNNSTYEGDYATVDDGFGNLQFIDRNGNIQDYGAIIKDKISKGLSYNDIFDEIQDYNNGFKKVKFAKKYTLINSNNELIGDGNLWFDDIRNFNNGFAKVKKNNKVSLIDIQGNLINNGKLWFDYIDSFENGFAEVKLNKKYSYLNMNGKLIGNGTLWFDYTSTFNSNGYALVQLNDVDYILDVKGNFYDFKTKKPIQNPFNKNNESFEKYINHIIYECFEKLINKKN